MAKYKPYEKYKDTGVEWIGQVPEHWKALKAKYLFTVITEYSSSGAEDLLSVSEYYGIARRKDKQKEDEFLTRAESLIGYRKCKKHDIVMNIMLAWKKGLGTSLYDGIVSPSYCVYRPLKEDATDTMYFHYLFRTSLYAQLFKQHSTGIIDSRLRLYPEKFLSLFVHVPPYQEQQTIANFLDHKTSEVDNLIADKEKLITLLQEYRQSVISEAVTKGLNPNVKMKDSGIEWIGEIPEHWSLSKVKYLTRCLDGKRVPLSSEERGSMQGEVPYWGANTIIDYVNDWILDGEFILLGEDGAPFFDRLRDVAFLSIGKIWPNNHVHVLSVMKQTEARFLVHCLNIVNYRDYIKGSTRDKLVQSEMNNIIVQLPPFKEQQAIADYLDQKTFEIDTLISGVQDSIAQLKTYRQSLISEAVTGKIDVREFDKKEQLR
jgi:type I restriction enzyme S subunit